MKNKNHENISQNKNTLTKTDSFRIYPLVKTVIKLQEERKQHNLVGC